MRVRVQLVVCCELYLIKRHLVRNTTMNRKKEGMVVTMDRRPKIGLLGLMTDGYEDVFPGILSRQKKYGDSIAESLSEEIDVVFEEIGCNRSKIEEIIKRYNEQALDGILIVLLAYSQGAWLVPGMKHNKLPVAVAVLQPDDEVKTEFEEYELTINQGIHGAQDNCNALMRLGIKYQVFAGSRFSREFKDFGADFAKSAQSVCILNKMRIGVIGRMQGMGDILTDEMGLFKRLGIEICHDSLGCIYTNMQKLTPEEIEKERQLDFGRFVVDNKLTKESHEIAIAQYLGFKQYLEGNQYDGFTAHFDMFGQDGRFRQLPLYAASRLMADGYGYAAEGDIVCAAMVKVAHVLSGAPANFTEMYMMDAKTESILFCHAGEGNYTSIAQNKTPRLIDRYLGEGGLENPPTILFAPKPGKATLVSLVSVSGDHFRLVCATGEILDKEDLHKCEMPYLFFRPDSGVKSCVENWLRQGGTHHEVICQGDMSGRWKMLCQMLDVEYVEV